MWKPVWWSMKANIVYVLKGLASVALGLGVYQFLGSLNALSFISSNLMFLPPLVLVALSFLIVFKIFKKDRKFQVPILLLIVFLGFTAASFFGHQSGLNELKKSGVQVVE